VRAAIDPPADAAAVVNAVCDAAVRRDREAAERRIERRASLLRDELRGVEIELNEAVGRQIREVEIQLGGGGGTAGTPPAGRAKQLQFDRLLEEEARVRARVSGHRTRLQTFRRALDEGRTPPEVEVRINDNPRYVRARQRLDDLEAEQGPLPPMSRPRPDDVNLEPGALTRKPDKADPPGKAGERADPGKEGGEAAAAARKQRRVAAQEKVDEIREELKSTYTEAMKEALGNEIAAASADAARVEEAVTRVGEQMAELNKLTGEYRHLLDRRQELRRRQGALADEIARPGGELHLVQRAAGPR
jgi:hypothetical protein